MIRLREYIGKGMPNEVAERVTATYIAPKHLKKEPALYRMKWWDYRRLHHAEATCLFAAFYFDAVQAAHAKFLDLEESRHRRTRRHIFGKDFTKGLRTSLWLARQAADEYGLPYGYFCSFAINGLMESYTWQHVPLPAHLYQDGVMEIVTHRWDWAKRATLQRATDPFFDVKNYRGHPDQDAYQDWVCGQISLRASPEFALADLLNVQIPLERARRHFEAGRVNRAVELCQ